MRLLPLALALVPLATGIGACGAGGVEADPCADCPAGSALHCFTEPGAPGAEDERVACVQPCAAGPCDPGRTCIENGGVQVCSPYCDTSACPPRRQCGVEGGVRTTCGAVPGDCSDRVPCEDAASICDPAAFACHPANGACADDDACPHFERAFTDTKVTCAEGFCRAAPAPPRQAEGLRTSEAVPVSRPAAGEAFARLADVRLEWDAAGEASIALVLDSAPTPFDGAESIRRRVVWALGRPRGPVQEAALATEGSPVVEGVAQEGLTGIDPATSGTLHALVQTVRSGTLVAASAVIPFRVGTGWPAGGAACLETGEIPGNCASPAAALACVAGICRTLCASHLDCPGALCGPPRLLLAASAGLPTWYRACE